MEGVPQSIKVEKINNNKNGEDIFYLNSKE